MQYDQKGLGTHRKVRWLLHGAVARQLHAALAHAARAWRSDIKGHYEDYDGFVVLHGTDTMAYTASALSFMLVNLSKPVVLTGAGAHRGSAACHARAADLPLPRLPNPPE